MDYSPIMNFLFLFVVLISFTVQPVFSQTQKLRTGGTFISHSEHFLGLQNGLRSSDKNVGKFNINYDTNNSSSQLVFNYNGNNNFTLDESYLQYSRGIVTFGVGAVDRHWSFSKNTSLILSHNARPSKSIYLKLKNKLGNHYLRPKTNWSIEVFNGFTEGSLDNANSMLFGIRAIITPIERLSFELVQTSQWGGKGYDNGLTGLGSALFFDTNESSNSNINKMAGFGFSYTTINSLIPLRVYGQAIGEDEAGSLPSCYAYLAGAEWSNKKIKYPITLGIEAVNTRTKISTNGYCGPNSIYNNYVYKYTNYGKTMGSEIDTEGNSIEFFGKSQISQELNIDYSSKAVVINGANWPDHRLSSNRQTGLINSLGITWAKNYLNLNGNIYYQGFFLDKANVKDGYGIGFSSSIIF
jgi:hypothetical protein